MNSAIDVLKVLVGLYEVNDLKLIEDPLVAKAVCDPQLLPLARKMASGIEAIFASFQYEDSPEFSAAMEGKSAKYREMSIRLLTPEKRRSLKGRLGFAIAEILESDEAYRLIPTESHCRLDELKSAARSIPPL